MFLLGGVGGQRCHVLCRILDAYLVRRLVDALSEIDVISLLRAGTPISEVAMKLGLDRNLLYRVIEALEEAGVFRWVDGTLTVKDIQAPSPEDFKRITGFSPHSALAVDVFIKYLINRLRSGEDRSSVLFDKWFYLMAFSILHVCPAMFHTKESLLSYLGFKPKNGTTILEFVGVPYGDTTIAILDMLHTAAVDRFKYIAILPSKKLCGEWENVVRRWCGELGIPENYLSSIEYEICDINELGDFICTRDWSGRFDYVVSSSFLHWLPHEARLNYISYVFKLLRDGGQWFNLCSLYSRGRVTVFELLFELFTEFYGCVSEHEFRRVSEMFHVKRKVVCNLMTHSSLSFCANKRGGAVGISGEVLFLGKMYHYSFGTSV